MSQNPYEIAGEQLGERMPRLIAKYQTELVAMQAVFTDPLARIAKDRAIVEVASSSVVELMRAQDDIKDFALDEAMVAAAKARLEIFDAYGVEKELNDAVLKLQEAFGALEDLAQLYAKVAKELGA